MLCHKSLKVHTLLFSAMETCLGLIKLHNCFVINTLFVFELVVRFINLVYCIIQA